MVRIPVCRSTRVVLLINTTQNPFIKLHTYTGKGIEEAFFFR
ncbi:hypothetical protein HanXRQr2_Chr15g0698721 [Helianthus annuus]|uniref:Uncharacterized protein n=1 Tax=Helianthus annuus TaxID=4232 RepID=A0A9K3H3R5_HELAN|nr:hypothetical protein HanXRQr2_Chr15g0698721 [Helianthus annuus]KAJ0831724.1 hypothetical protein HanPSC8_Chr15g0670391 [Helianthus annuus]